jgi:hypothetical protein
MPRIVALDAPSRARLERFLAAARGRDASLEGVRLVAGRLGAAVAGCARASGVTLGGTIFLSRAAAELLARDGRAPLVDRLGDLLVHECVHVLQYREAGTVRFLFVYLYDYFTSLLEQASMHPVARHRAYLEIRAEREAFDVAARWAGRV